jgi:hypothetical protein
MSTAAPPKKQTKPSRRRERVKRKKGLDSGTFDWDTAPQPTGGQLVPDDDHSLIHGASLIAHDSRNGFRWSLSALESARDLINEAAGRGRPIPVQAAHHDPTAEENGAIKNAYIDETGENPVLRVSWILNPHNGADRWIYNARHTPGNVMFSLEAWEREVEEAGSKDGPLVTKVMGIRWVTLTKFGGSTSALSETGVEKMSEKALPKTAEELKSIAPDLYSAVVESVATLEANQLEELTTQRDEAVARVDEYIAKETKAGRTKEITEEFAALLKDVSADKLPEGEAGDKFREQLSITESDMDKLVVLEAEEVTKELGSRADFISLALGLISESANPDGYTIQSAENSEQHKSKTGESLTFGKHLSFGDFS